MGEEEGGFHSSPSKSAESFKVGEFVVSIGDGSPLQVSVGEIPPELAVCVFKIDKAGGAVEVSR